MKGTRAKVAQSAATAAVAVLVLLLVSSVSSAAPIASKNPAPVHPSNRWGPNMVYDAKDGYVLLFGGSTNQNYTWKFSDGKWTDLNIAVAPPSRAHGGIAYDAADGYVVLFGGSSRNVYYNDTWEYSGGSGRTSPRPPAGARRRGSRRRWRTMPPTGTSSSSGA